VEPTARALGAVNTLVRRDDGGLRGENTDWQGAFGAVRTAADAGGVLLEGRTALLLGAGGAARGIAHALLAAGCRVVVANRTAGRAEALARELGVDAAPLDEAVAIARDGDCAVVANSTSVGMHPEVDATPIPAEAFGPDMVAFDAVYNPRETRMLREARERGAAIADGVAMFVGQAARQFALWTGREPPLDVMESVVARRLAGK
jgi:3-dehydroquinate dehydratase/shikimate dehydrogenase